MSAFLEIGDQRAVVRADIDDQIVGAQREKLRGLSIELSEIVAQQLGHSAGVGISRRKDDGWIDHKAQLDQFALVAK